jgi:uncharacterized membrane protein YgdD (TMEM256/DUF423 family)
MKKEPKQFLLLASLFGFSGVALGAFGAHGLKSMVTPELLDVFKTGTQYQMYHTFALVSVGILAEKYPAKVFTISGWLFVAGVALFSGSLYALALIQVRQIGLITPFGGLCFLAGWISMGMGIAKIKKEN